MKVIVNKESGSVTRVISNSSILQQLKENEIEIETDDSKLIDAFNEGHEILYNKVSGQLYYEPKIEIDTEKAVLYEAVANLFEEVQILKAQLGGEK